jgi:hypothetical protein
MLAGHRHRFQPSCITRHCCTLNIRIYMTKEEIRNEIHSMNEDIISLTAKITNRTWNVLRPA